jgi:hypothetical protein
MLGSVVQVHLSPPRICSRSPKKAAALLMRPAAFLLFGDLYSSMEPWKTHKRSVAPLPAITGARFRPSDRLCGRGSPQYGGLGSKSCSSRKADANMCFVCVRTMYQTLSEHETAPNSVSVSTYRNPRQRASSLNTCSVVWQPTPSAGHRCSVRISFHIDSIASRATS